MCIRGISDLPLVRSIGQWRHGTAPDVTVLSETPGIGGSVNIFEEHTDTIRDQSSYGDVEVYS